MKHKIIKLISVIIICAFALEGHLVPSSQCSVVSKREKKCLVDGNHKLGTGHWALNTALRPSLGSDMQNCRSIGIGTGKNLRPLATGEGGTAAGKRTITNLAFIRAAIIDWDDTVLRTSRGWEWLNVGFVAMVIDGIELTDEEIGKLKNCALELEWAHGRDALSVLKDIGLIGSDRLTEDSAAKAAVYMTQSPGKTAFQDIEWAIEQAGEKGVSIENRQGYIDRWIKRASWEIEDIKNPDSLKSKRLAPLRNASTLEEKKLALADIAVPGSIERLRRMIASGMELFIVSGAGESVIREEVELTGLFGPGAPGRVRGCRPDEPNVNKQTHFNGILKELWSAGVVTDPSQVMACGDGLTEIRIGALMGMTTVGVAADRKRADMLRAAGAQAIVADFTDALFDTLASPRMESVDRCGRGDRLLLSSVLRPLAAGEGESRDALKLASGSGEGRPLTAGKGRQKTGHLRFLGREQGDRTISHKDMLRQRPLIERITNVIEEADYEMTFPVELGDPEKYLYHADRGPLPLLVPSSLKHSCRWPIDIRLPFEIHPYRNEGGEEANSYMDYNIRTILRHGGIDIHCAPGTEVRAVQDGMLWGPWKYRSWGVDEDIDLGAYVCIVTPDKIIWTFVHIDMTTFPEKIVNRRPHDPLQVRGGEFIGLVHRWPESEFKNNRVKYGQLWAPEYVTRVVDSKGTHLHVDVQVYSDNFFKFGSFEYDAEQGRLREMGIEFNPLHLLRLLNIKIRREDVTPQRCMRDASDRSLLSAV